MKSHVWQTAALLWLLSPGWACGQDFCYLNSKLKKSQRPICSMLVLPAEVTVTMAGIRGSEGLWKEGDRFEDELTALVAVTLRERGSAVSQVARETGTQAEDLEELALIQSRFDSISALIDRRPADVRKGRFTIGDSAAGYAPASAHDTLVLIRGRGGVPAGKLGGAGGGGRFVGTMTFVNARSGEVLARAEFACDRHGWASSTAELKTHLQEVWGEDAPVFEAALRRGRERTACPAK